jgi:hypothetical protein
MLRFSQINMLLLACFSFDYFAMLFVAAAAPRPPPFRRRRRFLPPIAAILVTVPHELILRAADACALRKLATFPMIILLTTDGASAISMSNY